ncbi:MAG: DUF3783 domain-containing protein [Spirochaetota bacterium]
MEDRIIVLNGFTPDEALLVMRAVKAALPGSGETAFAMTTATNLGWKLSDLLLHVAEEHRQFMEARSKSRQN